MCQTTIIDVKDGNKVAHVYLIYEKWCEKTTLDFFLSHSPKRTRVFQEFHFYFLLFLFITPVYSHCMI